MGTESQLSSIPGESSATPTKRRDAWLAGGGVIGAVLASACCVLPLVLFSLGIGGAWIGQLTALAPYQPWFWAAGALFVAGGLISVWRGRRACRVDGSCRPSRAQRVAHVGLWLAAALLVVSALWPFIVPVLIG